MAPVAKSGARRIRREKKKRKKLKCLEGPSEEPREQQPQPHQKRPQSQAHPSLAQEEAI